MTFASFCGCAGRFVSGLVGNSRRHVLLCRGSYTALEQTYLLVNFVMSQCMTKQTKWHVRQTKTQIGMDIHPFWSESSLTPWRNLEWLITWWTHRKDWLDWADIQADLSLRWVHIILWVLPCASSYVFILFSATIRKVWIPALQDTE